MSAAPVTLIAGPTASGKSALALRLARAAGGEIVNADSMQVYADLRVLTARPSSEDEAAAPHHLFGVADAAEAWSVGRWLRAATVTLAEIAGRGRPAIVVGGTGLYFRALTQGLAEVAGVPAAVRAKVQALYDDIGEAAFRTRLAEVDPAAAERIAAADRQRLTRAYEVFAATGRPLSALQARTSPALAAGSWRGLVLEPPREAIHARCDLRLEAMLEAGALEEVARLIGRGLDARLPAMKALGVAPFAAHLRGEIGLDEAVARTRQDTRRYAKRQATWFRNQAPDWPRARSAEEVIGDP
ncbi:MAG TPA: tRNA (adenosine(37)-N6)-dimethylallyltransferase MiaA [Caulobacteraceae bacterium]|nr:tRNA (adenosine(37)-N6)-dimethylallyltransferase MiaA [Caulobacteraceae bacterium]